MIVYTYLYTPDLTNFINFGVFRIQFTVPNTPNRIVRRQDQYLLKHPEMWTLSICLVICSSLAQSNSPPFDGSQCLSLRLSTFVASASIVCHSCLVCYFLVHTGQINKNTYSFCTKLKAYDFLLIQIRGYLIEISTSFYL